MFTKSRSTVRLLALLLIGVECVVYMMPLVTDSNQCLSPLAALTKDEVYACSPGAVARSEASSLVMQAAPSSIPTSGTFFHGDLVMKTFLRPFSLFR